MSQRWIVKCNRCGAINGAPAPSLPMPGRLPSESTKPPETITCNRCGAMMDIGKGQWLSGPVAPPADRELDLLEVEA